MSDWESEGSDATPRRGEQWPSPTANAGTITAPYAEPLSPYMRARLEAIARDVDIARRELARILGQS